MYPPLPRTSMPGPILLALLRISTFESQAKIRCRPPRGVMVAQVGGSGPRCTINWSSVALPSIFLAGSRSRSTVHKPLAGPIGAPIMALGYCCHQARICVSSRVASLNPFAVSGRLSIGLHGKTGMPQRA
jgi:hypothetical protein